MYSANTGSNKICFSGCPKATTVSLWMYKPNVWKPKNKETQLKCEIIASLCSNIRAKTLFLFNSGS